MSKKLFIPMKQLGKSGYPRPLNREIIRNDDKMKIMVVVAVFAMLLILTGVVNAAIFYVPDNYTTIEAAINAASPGDTIIVRSGIYYENVILNKRLSLIGEGLPTINAQYRGNAITITADNCVVKGFRCIKASIKSRCAQIRIKSNRNIIENNICDGNAIGIHLLNSSWNIIKNNTFRNCGLYTFASYNNEIEGNIVNGKPLVYLEGVSDRQIRDAGQVVLVKCENITVRDCNISRTTVGIQLWKSSNCTIINNKVLRNYFGIGISLSNSSKVIIFNNTCENSYYGVSLLRSSWNIIKNNTFRNCGLYTFASYNNEIEGNIVNGKPLVYLEGVSDRQIRDAGQVVLVKCENITVRDCNISRTTVGIQLWKSSNCTIINNKVTENQMGGICLCDSSKNRILNNTCKKNDDNIHLWHSSKNKILKNEISSGNAFGISLYYSPENKISRNNIYNSKFFGIFLRYSSNNLIYLNNFINNSLNIYSYNSDNIWNSTRPITYIYDNRTYRNYMGNYWGNYPGKDADDDGIGDTPYKVNGNDYDYYPLIQPLEFYSRRIGNPMREIRDMMKMKPGEGVLEMDCNQFSSPENRNLMPWNWEERKMSV